MEASGQEAEGARRRCVVCAAPLRPSPVGRKPRHCSNACRQVAYRLRRNGERKRRLVRLVEADARELLASLPDGSVDLIVTDPPYEFDRGQGRFRNWFGASIADEDWPGIFAELHRVLRSDAHAYVFADRRTVPLFDAAAKAAGFRARMPLIWDKCSVGLGGIWRSQHELIGFYEKGTRAGNYRNRGDVLRAARVSRGYPTEKPVRLLRQLVSQSSVRGELVLDPFCGSGSTGKAARELGRRGLLCDVDAGFAAKRLRLAIELLERAAAWRNGGPDDIRRVAYDSDAAGCFPAPRKQSRRTFGLLQGQQSPSVDDTVTPEGESEWAFSQICSARLSVSACARSAPTGP